jgi:hypothetical protein
MTSLVARTGALTLEIVKRSDLRSDWIQTPPLGTYNSSSVRTSLAAAELRTLRRNTMSLLVTGRP